MRYNTDEEGIEMRALQNCASVVPGTGGDVLWIEALRYEQCHFEESTKQIKTTEQLSIVPMALSIPPHVILVSSSSHRS